MNPLPVSSAITSPIVTANPDVALDRSEEAQAQQCPSLGDWMDATLTAACLADRGRSIDVELHDALSVLPGNADASAQAVLMLLSNACRFSAAGTRLRLTTRVQWADGADHLVISVCDRGIGMTRAALQRAFDPISEASSKVEPKESGEPSTQREGAQRQGGLRIARSLMERQGGWIELRSALGIGTEAEAWVPMLVSADRQA